MRTSILIGALVIADSINPDWVTSEATGIFVAVVLVVGMFMDVFDFLSNN